MALAFLPEHLLKPVANEQARATGDKHAAVTLGFEREHNLVNVMNVPLIGIWVKMLQVPFRYMFPCALFFIAIGTFSTNNALFDVYEVLFFGIVGVVLLALDFPLPRFCWATLSGPWSRRISGARSCCRTAT